MKFQIPYGTGNFTCDIPGARLLTSQIDSYSAEHPGSELVAAAMAAPVAGPRLSELAAGVKNAVILISDHTRPVPSRDILPGMLRELRSGNPDISVTLLVATGCHRGTTRDELIQKLGQELVASEHIAVHDAFDPSQNVSIGILPSGAPLVLDRRAVETDLLLAEGFIEPHFFAGFSGGRKSVLPGICDRVTVLGNHCGAFIDDPRARTGILEGNPIHRDMEAAAEMAKLRYIVNVVINGAHETVAAFAGSPKETHAAGVAFLRHYCEVPAIPGDIVITGNGGAPLDQNLYQCVKSMTAAEASAKPGATIILCAALADGIGGDGFYHALRDCESPAALYRAYAATPQTETVADQWQSQILCRILDKHSVIVVTGPEMASVVREMKMEYAENLDTALAMACPGEITVIPNGVSIIVQPACISV